MRPILWHVESDGEPPVFHVLFPDPGGHRVAVVAFRDPPGAGDDARAFAEREITSWTPEAVELVRAIARPLDGPTPPLKKK